MNIRIKQYNESYIKGQIKKIQSALLSSKKHQTKDGYIYLLYYQNQYLFTLLDSICFFDFHSSNIKRTIVYEHQIILYCFRGWRRFLLSSKSCIKGETEIHHLDHNPQNNSPDNLIYVTPYENKILAQLTKNIYKGFTKLLKQRPLNDFVKLALNTVNKTFNLNWKSFNFNPNLDYSIFTFPVQFFSCI